jgi:predicted dehydrogenase
MVRDGAAPPVDPEDAVSVLAVLDAARRSAREGTVVRLPT